MGAARNLAPFRLKVGLVGLVSLVSVSCAQTAGTTLGVITNVEGTLEQVESFTVLSDGIQTVFIPLTDREYEFPLTHLREHLRTGEPVFVGWEEKDSTKYVTSVADG